MRARGDEPRGDACGGDDGGEQSGVMPGALCVQLIVRERGGGDDKDESCEQGANAPEDESGSALDDGGGGQDRGAVDVAHEFAGPTDGFDDGAFDERADPRARGHGHVGGMAGGGE